MYSQPSYARYTLHSLAGFLVWIALHIIITALAPILCAVSPLLMVIPVGIAILLTLSFVIHSYLLGRGDSLSKVYPIGEIERFAGIAGSAMNLIALALILTTAFSLITTNPCTVMLMEQL